MNSNKTTVQIGGIDFIFQAGDPAKPAVIMMHGYGANWEDLYPLHTYLSPEAGWNWYFPNAPLEVPLGMMMSGRAWFPIDVEAMNEAMSTGAHRDFRSLASDDFSLMVQRLEGIYSEIAQKHDQYYIGGFSQGAMLASHLAFRIQKSPVGLLLFSGNLVDENKLGELINKDQKIKYFQSHGDRDPLLSLSGARALHDKLSTAGHSGEFFEFAGEHSLPMDVLNKAQSFLKSSADSAR